MAVLDPTASISRLGFRKWYERELIKSHASLVTCLLCGLAIPALIETIDLHHLGWAFAPKLGLVAAAIGLGWASWKTYIRLLTRAELYGERSNCPSCQAYGRFNVIATGMDRDEGRVAEAVAPLPAAWLRVQCRACGTGWRMPE